MRVLYFSRDYTPHDHRFLTSLAGTDHEVHYLRLERRSNALEDRPLPANIEQTQWDGGQNSVRLRDSGRLYISLRRIIHRLKPDLIHAGPIQTAAFLTALSGFKNLVSMSWGYDLLKDANRGKVCRWATRYTLLKSAALVADCQAVRNRAVTFGMAPSRIVIFPWGVDLVHFNPGDKKKDSVDASAPFTLLSTRSWEPIYGVDILAHAFIKAAQEFPQLRLVMVGNGSLAGQLRMVFQRAQVLDRVIFPGRVSQADLPNFYRAADLYISASHVDGSSVSLLEALACGCPVVVSDIPGNLEWITPGLQGWVFPDGDSEALYQCISQAVQEKSRLTSMGIASRSLAEARADWNANFPRLEQAYQVAVG